MRATCEGTAVRSRDVAARAGCSGPCPRVLGEIDDQQVDRPTREQGAGDRDALVDVGGGHDDEPLRPDPAGHRLDRIEGLGEVQPGDDRAGGLGLRGQAEREGRPTARDVAPERQAHPAWQAARTESGVQGRKARREDAGRVRLADRLGAEIRIGGGILQWHRGKRALDRAEAADGLAESRGSGRAPLRPKGRQGRRHVRGECRHGSSIEHAFE